MSISQSINKQPLTQNDQSLN